MSQPNCPCDAFVHPQPLSIDAGLTRLPRQIAGFAQFRHAMLSALPSHPELAAWRARGDQDLGVMLIEMWAYVCDVVAFYDETIAHEVYLRSARLTPSVRKLVALLGYLPRPAVAARAQLVVKAAGRQPLLLPAGTSFRSAAFGGEPPQVFELEANARVHPLLNGWSVAPVRAQTLPAANTLLLAPGSATAKTGDRLLLLCDGAPGGVLVALAVTPVSGRDGQKYKQLTLSENVPGGASVAGTRVLRPTASAALWSNPSDSSWSLHTGTTQMYLASLVPQIRAGDYVIATGPSGSTALHVTSATQSTRLLAPGVTIPNTSTSTPAVRVAVTWLSFSPAWPASMGTSTAQVRLEYGLQDAGVVTAERKTRVDSGDPLALEPPVEAPLDASSPGKFLIADIDGNAQELTASLDFEARRLTPGQGSTWTTALAPPLTVYANVVDVSRGESVPSELLGLGDASLANQTFKLKKKPLTYLSAPTSANSQGLRSTLSLRVRDIAWYEVRSFFGVGNMDTVFIVRQDDAGESWVSFGDGVHGARLPAGAPVVASYRFGAGESSPPSGAITQLGKPVNGLRSVRNPLPAFGGADREPASQVRVYAPRSALLFGRAVSIKDMEALAAGVPGVQAVQAQWCWDATKQLPAVRVWFIGPASLATTVSAALRAATAPATPIQASPATPLPASLLLEVSVDRRYERPLVQAALAARLTAAGTGLFAPERVGIGAPLLRSQLLAEALAEPGVRAVRGVIWQGAPLDAYAVSPGDGAWFQVTLTVVVAEDPHG